MALPEDIKQRIAAALDAERKAGTVRTIHRTVCGKPHKTRKAAERAVRSALAWGWGDVRVEARAGGEYYVVTGEDLPHWYRTAGKNLVASGEKLGPRYRWPGK